MGVQLGRLGILAVLLDATSAFLLPLAVRVSTPSHAPFRQLCAHDMSVTLPGGEVKTVAVEEGQSILEALEAHDIDAPHSCRSGLCTE